MLQWQLYMQVAEPVILPQNYWHYELLLYGLSLGSDWSLWEETNISQAPEGSEEGGNVFSGRRELLKQKGTHWASEDRPRCVVSCSCQAYCQCPSQGGVLGSWASISPFSWVYHPQTMADGRTPPDLSTCVHEPGEKLQRLAPTERQLSSGQPPARCPGVLSSVQDDCHSVPVQ